MPSWLRWTLVAPAALIAGYLAYSIGGFVNRLSITLIMGPPTGWVQLAAIFMEQMYMGAAIPYVAGRVAPNKTAYTALGFSGFVMVFAGVSLGIWLTNDTSNTLAEQVASIAGLLWGAGAVGIATYHGEFGFGEEGG